MNSIEAERKNFHDKNAFRGRYDNYDPDYDEFDYGDDEIEYFNLTEIVFDEGFGPDGEPISSDEESNDPTERQSPGTVPSMCPGDDSTVVTSGNEHPHNPQCITNNAPISDAVYVTTQQPPSSDITLGDSLSVIEERWGSVHVDHCDERKGKDVLLEEDCRGEEESSPNATNQQTVSVEINSVETSQIDSEAKGEELTLSQSSVPEGFEHRYYGVTRRNEIFTRTGYFQPHSYNEATYGEVKSPVRGPKPIPTKASQDACRKRERGKVPKLSESKKNCLQIGTSTNLLLPGHEVGHCLNVRDYQCR